MHNIYFYEDHNGNSPVLEYIEALSKRTDKDSRINHNKINDYFQFKQTNKTPKRELAQAKRNLADIRERSVYK